MSYEEKPVEILDRKMKTLRNKEISLVKVLWRNHKIKEATWEQEDTMRASYPEIFYVSRTKLFKGGRGCNTHFSN